MSVSACALATISSPWSAKLLSALHWLLLLVAWFSLSTDRHQVMVKTHQFWLPVQWGCLVRKCHFPDAWSVDKYHHFFQLFQRYSWRKRFCLRIDLNASETTHQLRIMSFYIYSAWYFWFLCSKVSGVMKSSSFLTFALHEKNIPKDRNHRADLPSGSILCSASSSLLPWNTSPHHLFVSLVPSFSNACTL